MPKKKKEKLLERREHKGIEYTVNENEKGDLVYRTKFGDEPDTVLTGSSKRSLTIQMKKEIEMRLEIGNKPKAKPVQELDDQTLDDMSKEEIEELFNPDAYKDDDEPEIIEIDEDKAVGKKMAFVTMDECQKCGVKPTMHPDTDLCEECASDVEKDMKKIKGELDKDTLSDIEGSEKGAFDIIEGDPTFENEEEDEVYGANEGIELSEAEKTVVEALKSRKPYTLPKTKLKGEIKFVVVNGKFYGQISPRTFVTIERNRFKMIEARTFTTMRKGKTIRVMPLDILYIINDFNYELTFRFLVLNSSHDIGKADGRMCLIPNGGELCVRMDEKTLFDVTRFYGLMIPKESSILKYEKMIPSGPIKYPSGRYDLVSNQIMFINEDYRYDKEMFANIQKIMEVVPTKTVINPDNRILATVTKDETMGILQAPLKEEEETPEENIQVDESEIDEIDEEE